MYSWSRRHAGVADGRDDAVQDDREAGREEQAEAARRGDEAQREALGVAVLAEDRVDEAAERDDGDARSRPVNVVNSAQTAATITAMPPGIQPNKRAEEPDQPLGRGALGEHVAGTRSAAGSPGSVGEATSR